MKCIGYAEVSITFIGLVKILDNSAFRNVNPTNQIACSQRVIIAVLCGPKKKYLVNQTLSIVSVTTQIGLFTSISKNLK